MSLIAAGSTRARPTSGRTQARTMARSSESFRPNYRGRSTPAKATRWVKSEPAGRCKGTGRRGQGTLTRTRTWHPFPRCVWVRHAQGDVSVAPDSSLRLVRHAHGDVSVALGSYRQEPGCHACVFAIMLPCIHSAMREARRMKKGEAIASPFLL